MSNGIIFHMGTHTYVARIKKIEEEEGGYYFVQFPSLKGCFTYGNTLEEAIAMGKDVLELWLSVLKDEKKPLPTEKRSLLKKTSILNIPLSVSV